MARARASQVEPVIRHTPGVCGGAARIRNTRIPVWGLESLRRLGAADQAILEDYPSLTIEDLAAAWQYVAEHSAEIDELIQRNEAA